MDFAKLLPNEKHIFISNLQYQILLDSVQGRSPNIAFLPIVSLPELETGLKLGRSLKPFIRALTRTSSVPL
jgi:ribonucleoside-diphosphate reductase class Ia beta subunit (EC 1.17.4.1)